MRCRGLALVLAASLAPPAAADIRIAISGDATARYRLLCEAPGRAGPFRAAGRPPARHRIAGPRHDCTLRQTAEGARIAVTVESDSGNRSRLATAGAGSVLRFVVE